jgi:hypothetical protein
MPRNEWTLDEAAEAFAKQLNRPHESHFKVVDKAAEGTVIITVRRLVEYTGPEEWVRNTLAHSLPLGTFKPWRDRIITVREIREVL